MASHPRTQSDSRCIDDAPGPIRSMHDVFSNWDRCAILYYLKQNEGPADVDGVAEHLVAWSRGRTEPEPRDEAVADAVKPHVVHAHVQRLDRFGIAVYDPCEGTVELSDDVEVMVSPPWRAEPDGIDSDVMDQALSTEPTARDQPEAGGQ